MALLIIVFIGLAPYIKKSNSEGFANPVVEGFQTSDGISTDAQNPTISESSIYGLVPQAASISIYRKAEARAATANPDGLVVNEASGSVEVPLTQIPDVPPSDPEDIETVLNQELAAEGFFDYGMEEGFQNVAQANKAIADAQAAKAKADAAAAIARDPGAAIYGKATAGASAAATAKSQAAVGSALAATGLTGGAAIAAGMVAEKVRGDVQAKLEAKAQEKVLALARAKMKKLVGKQVSQAKKFVVKGAKKVATKISNKLSAKLGNSFLKKIISKIAAKIAAVIGKKAAIASAQSAAFSASVVMAPVGIILGIITIVALSIQVAMAAVLKGDEGVCDAGWARVSEKWPSWLDNIPGVGDLMGALAPYMCYLNACGSELEEDAGLCYTKCEAGYKGVGPVCWSEYVTTGVGVLKGCPPGWSDDGLICRQPITYNKISCSTNKNGSIWPHNWSTRCSGGDFSGGRLIGKMNAEAQGGGELRCPGSHPDDINGLCYAQCPLKGGNPYTFTRKWPIYIRPKSNKKELAARAALDAAKKAVNAKGEPSSTPAEIQRLTTALGDAIKEDLKLPPDMTLNYIRNPEGPREKNEPVWDPMPTQSVGWPSAPSREFTPAFAAGKNGGIYVLRNNEWIDFNTYIGKWSNVPTAMRIAASCNGMPVVIDKQNSIWRYLNNKWVEFGGKGTDIAGHTFNCNKGDGSTLEMLLGTLDANKNGAIYRWWGNGWAYINGGGMRIAAGQQTNDEYTVNAAGDFYIGRWTILFKFLGTNDLTTTPDNTLLISKPDGVFRWFKGEKAPTKFANAPPGTSIQNISADKDGFLYIQATDGFIYKSDKPIVKTSTTTNFIKLAAVPGGGAIDITGGLSTVTNPEYAKYENWGKYLEFVKKYPYPEKTTMDFDIPSINETVTVDPRKRLARVPGMPYQCVGERGISYGRGVGKPKLQLRMVKPTPPPPPPPATTNSAYYAENQATPCKVDFSDNKILQDMCQFYYKNARLGATENADKTISYGYISKITKVVASSEQSCDVLCDITSVILNPETGKTLSSNVTAENDRRFYFAKIVKGCTFIVTAATNISGTAPDVKDATNEPKAISFIPNIDKCAGIDMTLKQCNNKDAIDKMMKMYTDTQTAGVRVKQIDGAEATGADTCTLQWQEATYDAAMNKESAPMKKVGRFVYTQNKATDACAFTLQKYAAAPSTVNVAPLATPIVIPAPLPKEVTLKGCPAKCSDPIMLTKLIDAFNKKPGSSDRILSIKKAFTGGELRCDIEAEVYVKATKKVETQSIRFDMAKDGASCVFSVQKVGDAGSGVFIQRETPALGAAVNTQDFVMASATNAVKAAQTKLSGVLGQMTGYTGKANTVFEKTFADVGQLQTLGTCAKKCQDQDVLEAIVNWYNTTNYPSSRTNVTKKSISRIIKAGTASKSECDITFEEKQEYYTDLYNDVPKVTITQKTQRFNLKETSPCTFAVDTSEGFQNPGMGAGGLPMKPRNRPAVVNNAAPLLTPPFSSSGCELDCSKKEVLDAMKQKYDSNAIEGFSPRPKNPKTMGFFEYVGSWLTPLSEAFQDAEGEEMPAEEEEAPADSGVTDWTGEETVEQPEDEWVFDEEKQEWVTKSQQEASAVSEEEAVASEEEEWVFDEEKQEWVTKSQQEASAEAAEEEAAAPTPSLGQTMKTVNRALKLSPDKCEFEVLYDKTDMDQSGTVREQKDVTGYFTATFTKDPNGCVFMPLSVTPSTAPVIPGLPVGRASNISYSF